MVEWTDLVLMTPKSYEICFVDLILLFIGLFYVSLHRPWWRFEECTQLPLGRLGAQLLMSAPGQNWAF